MQNIGACGLNCSNCAAYNATQSNDLKKFQELAINWSNEKHQWKANDLICDGCTSNRVSRDCLECPVRICAQAIGKKICSRCSYYPCDKLQDRWKSLHGDLEIWKANLEKAK